MLKYIFLLCTFSLSLFSQKEFDNWYFGSNKGITFNTPDREPAPLLSGKTRAIEGSCSISDPAGNLLFYVAWNTIYNREHNPMPHNMNGQGAGKSSTQAAAIIRKPGSDHIYYVVTTGEFEDRELNIDTNYMRLWTVDMKADNGRGDLMGESVILSKEQGEKLAVYPHANKKDAWLIATRWSAGQVDYLVYPVTENGFETEKVQVIRSPYAYENYTGQGQLKISMDGNYLVAAHHNNCIELARFDNCNGRIYDNIFLTPFFPETRYYSLEFSPNSKKLYVQSENTNGSKIIQYDISAYDKQEIESTLEMVPLFGDANQGFRLRSMQLGPNGKIYIISCLNCSTYHSIENPDAAASDLRFKEHSYGGQSMQGHLAFPTAVIYKIGDYTCPEEPCIISGLISVPDTIVNTGDGFCMPVVLELHCRSGAGAELPSSLSFNVKMEYNPKVFLPGEGDYSIISDTRINRFRSITEFRFTDIPLDPSGRDTVFICGQTYLNDSLFTLLDIVSMETENRGDMVLQDGTLSLRHCAEGLMRILFRPLNPVKVGINQEESMVILQIETAEEGLTETEVYDISGNLVYSSSFTKAGAGYSEHSLQIGRTLARGTYIANVRSGRQSVSRIFFNL